MKYFLDTEFIEDGKTIDLISIGIVSENGDYYYAENDDCDLSKANPWVIENVLPKLAYNFTPKEIIKEQVLSFCKNPEFWGYYADYDWVALCQIFGKMVDLPVGWPMYCRDLKQLADSVGSPKFTRSKGIHNALDDAFWNRDYYNFLIEKSSIKPLVWVKGALTNTHSARTEFGDYYAGESFNNTYCWTNALPIFSYEQCDSLEEAMQKAEQHYIRRVKKIIYAS